MILVFIVALLTIKVTASIGKLAITAIIELFSFLAAFCKFIGMILKGIAKFIKKVIIPVLVWCGKQIYRFGKFVVKSIKDYRSRVKAENAINANSANTLTLSQNGNIANL